VKASPVYFIKANSVYHRMNKQALDFRSEFDELISFDEKAFALLLR